ncbi:retinoic acid receptor gamma-like [Centruroides sculpturatus]|uniref:retinoic acid receptor gamma-like n=1 Tax=Centruroides sculpturatus TaxID=218467 RepID=UPI000C6D2517|nr:retinoic acid receptor gamma-like [Centruroides sculpturatus]
MENGVYFRMSGEDCSSDEQDANDTMNSVNYSERKCPVCCTHPAILNTYGVWACLHCSDFFYNNVVKLEVPRCQRIGNCLLMGENDCSFCWLNKCYEVGMDADKISYGENYLSIRFNRMVETRKGIRLNVMKDEDQLLQYIPHLQQMFIKASKRIKAFKILPVSHQIKITEECLIRGIIMELT